MEDYVLAAIGHLSAEEEKKTAHRVQVLFRSRKPWRSVLRVQFGLTSAVSNELSLLWTAGQAAAAENARTLTPRDFATMVVEENFMDVVDIVGTALEARRRRRATAD